MIVVAVVVSCVRARRQLVREKQYVGAHLRATLERTYVSLS